MLRERVDVLAMNDRRQRVAVGLVADNVAMALEGLLDVAPMPGRRHDDDTLRARALAERGAKRSVYFGSGEGILRVGETGTDEHQESGKNQGIHTADLNHGQEGSKLPAIARADTEINGKSLMANEIWECLINDGLLTDTMVLFSLETTTSTGPGASRVFPSKYDDMRHCELI